MAEDLEQNIRDNAAGPKQASADGVNVQQHDLADQIAADKYLETRKASRTRGLGIKLLKISPPGTSE